MANALVQSDSENAVNMTAELEGMLEQEANQLSPVRPADESLLTMSEPSQASPPPLRGADPSQNLPLPPAALPQGSKVSLRGRLAGGGDEQRNQENSRSPEGRRPSSIPAKLPRVSGETRLQ